MNFTFSLKCNGSPLDRTEKDLNNEGLIPVAFNSLIELYIRNMNKIKAFCVLGIFGDLSQNDQFLVLPFEFIYKEYLC